MAPTAIVGLSGIARRLCVRFSGRCCGPFRCVVVRDAGDARRASWRACLVGLWRAVRGSGSIVAWRWACLSAFAVSIGCRPVCCRRCSLVWPILRRGLTRQHCWHRRADRWRAAVWLVVRALGLQSVRLFSCVGSTLWVVFDLSENALGGWLGNAMRLGVIVVILAPLLAGAQPAAAS